MELKGKALFNLLRISWLENRAIKVHPWQVEDLHALTLEELFTRLKQLGLILDEEGFYLYAENCESPEELVDYVWIEEEDLEGKEKTYLLLFELWRRLLPDKLSVSLFCDELDQLIELYDTGKMEDEEPLQGALIILEDILDDSTDKEGNPKKVFQEMAAYCAHDLETFLADYINDQIEAGNETYASELLDAFFDYVSKERRFTFLRARLMALSDLDEANRLYERIFEELREEPDLDLTLEVIESLIHHGDVRLFKAAVKHALPLLTTEDEYQNLVAMTAEYYRCLDKEEEEKALTRLLESRASYALDKKIGLSDKEHLYPFIQ